MKELERKIERLAKWSEKDAQKLRATDERVAEVYNVALRANIKDAKDDIYVYNKGTGPGRNQGSKEYERKNVLETLTRPGTLRRSIKTFRRSNKAITLAGPKTSRKGGSFKVQQANGWFASIVENGGFGPARNKGLFARTQKATSNRMKQPCATACCVRNLNAL